MSNFKKELHELETKILAQINKRILDAGNTQRLSLLVYKNENTLRSILHRCEKSSPLKLVKLHITLEQIDKAIASYDDLLQIAPNAKNVLNKSKFLK